MKVIVIGCGRVGAGLARTLSLRGHTVTVIDNDATAFENLGVTFKGQTIEGVGFDRDVLIQAGVERADALAAVTTSDEANVVAARIARQVFHVPRVAARVYEPRKAEIYRRLGMMTVSPVTLGAHRLGEILSFLELHTAASLGDGEVDIVDVEAPHALIGRAINDLSALGEFQVTAITRAGKTFLPASGALFEGGDLLHIAVHNAAIDKLKALLGLTQGGGA